MHQCAPLALLFSLVLPFVAFAQGGRSTILGTVTDESGAMVPRVSVTVLNTCSSQFFRMNLFASYHLSKDFNLNIISFHFQADLLGVRVNVGSSVLLF